jgi:hypothetical protein
VVLEQFLCQNPPSGGASLPALNPKEQIATDAEGRSLFAIPVVARNLGSNTTHKFIMTRGRLRCPELDGGAFAVLNSDAFGFYRVQYDEPMLVLLLRNVAEVRETELCAIAVDTLFFFTMRGETPRYRRPSPQVLMSLVRVALERVRSHYLWQLLLPAVLQLLRALQLSDSFGHVATALREPINRFFESLKTENGEFAERGYLPLLEDVICLVCAPLDSYGLCLSSGCDDAFFRLAKEPGLFTGSGGSEVAALLRPIELSCRSPSLGEVTARSVLGLLAEPGTHPRLRPLLERIIAQCPHAAVVRELVAQSSDPVSLLERAPDAVLLARAVTADCVARGQPVPARVAEAEARHAAGDEIRRSFSLFSWRRGSVSRLSTSRISSRDSSQNSSPSLSSRTKGEERYVPWTQYALLGAVALGAVALGVTGWMLLKNRNSAGPQ